jgi:uncharacterized protein with von Willebrand factor type A (vWA) domain
MARRMAAMQAMLNSMTPEQRAQLQALSEQLLEDMDLRWQMDQLGGHLRRCSRRWAGSARYDFSGQDPLGFAEAAQLLDQLGDLDQLEQMLRGASARARWPRWTWTGPASCWATTPHAAWSHVGAGPPAGGGRPHRQPEGRMELTPKGLRRIGRNALSDLFSKLARDKLGPTRSSARRRPRAHVRHQGLRVRRPVQPPHRADRAQRGPPHRGRHAGAAHPGGLRDRATETVVRSSTVLMLDLSLSMPMRDNFLAAKKVAMALHSLISMQFPRDYLGIVGFSEVARAITPQELPEVSWDFVYGTNMQHGLLLSRQLLARQSGTKQIIMITDGEPTAHFEPGMASPFFSYPPVQETIDATLREVARCTREGIKINTFMLDATSYLRAFVEKLTRMNQGRAFFTTPETLGDYVLVDFIEQKRAMRTAGRRPA